jgi:hypothetical protein
MYSSQQIDSLLAANTAAVNALASSARMYKDLLMNGSTHLPSQHNQDLLAVNSAVEYATLIHKKHTSKPFLSSQDRDAILAADAAAITAISSTAHIYKSLLIPKITQ